MENKINYWIFNYMPKWEAASKEVAFLLENSSSFDKNLVAMNMRHRTFKIQGKKKFLPLPFSLIGLPLVKYFANSFSINHLFSSPGEKLLIPILSKLENSVLTITKDSATSLLKMSNNIDHFKHFGAIIVESKRHYDTFSQIGVDKDKLHLIYPGVAVHNYHKAKGVFKIFFASSPPSKQDFLSRGIYLLLEAAKKYPDVEFILAWRESHYAFIKDLIAEAKLKNITVNNGFIENMDELYMQAHAVVLPGLAQHSFKPCPHSVLESLSHAKPVLLSRPSSIANIIEKEQCGVVFNPDIESLIVAIDELRKNYDSLQKNCHNTVSKYFSKEVFLKKYEGIYTSLLNS